MVCKFIYNSSNSTVFVEATTSYGTKARDGFMEFLRETLCRQRTEEGGSTINLEYTSVRS